MILKSITLNNFKNFKGQHTFNFDKITLVQGVNGSGKSTLIKDSILFALYGYSGVALDSLPTRGESNSCSVKVEFDEHSIEREYPTNIKINTEIPFANNKEAQKYLDNKYKNVEYFRKFRMIDLQEGINILEEGKISLKKTLFKFSEDLFNTIRNNLQTKKRHREIYNKSNIQICSHFPSNKRLHNLNIGILDITERIYNLEREIRTLEKDYLDLIEKQGKLTSNKENFKNQKDKIIQYNSCPVCKKGLTDQDKIDLLRNISINIIELNNRINTLLSQSTDQKEIIDHIKEIKQKLQDKKEKASVLRIKLEDRIKMKDYKYTQEDVVIIQKAINELDNFASFYLTEWIKNLTPIINNIINKINFSINFVLDEKGNFDIKLIRDDNEYSYKDLSSGQKLMISIAFQMALLLEREETGLIIADEGFSNLDENNLQIIIDLFKKQESEKRFSCFN